MTRKAKSREHQRRHRPKIEPRDRMLIVCEGTKTEKFYFDEARQALRLNRGQAVVRVESGEGTNPKNIVETARKLKVEASREGNAFTSVYCVFDRDEHAYYQESIARAQNLKIRTIKSVPCFEYWILLHFKNRTAPYARTGDHSTCDCCLHDVKRLWPEYKKGHRHVYNQLLSRLEIARQHAKQRLAAAEADGSGNPSTEIHLLLEAMEALKESIPIQ